MRIWSLHPCHLDRMGLVACWRETLLAQAVLAGRTKGYRNHPQLERFRAQADPLAAVGAYLSGVSEEARNRGYRFDASRILLPPDAEAGGTGITASMRVTGGTGIIASMQVTGGQLEFEWQHLGRKLHERSPEYARRWETAEPTPHPIFRVIPGSVEPWERTGETGRGERR